MLCRAKPSCSGEAGQAACIPGTTPAAGHDGLALEAQQTVFSLPLALGLGALELFLEALYSLRGLWQLHFLGRDVGNLSGILQEMASPGLEATCAWVLTDTHWLS